MTDGRERNWFYVMKKQKILLIITCVMIAGISLPVQATTPIPDLLPIGQLDLDREPAQTEGESTDEEGGILGDGEETAQDVLQEDIVGAGVVLIADKTAEDYALAYERAKEANWGYTNLGICE